MSKIIVIVGLTATGKTRLSIELATSLNAEIINADATGVYKEPLIATAKISPNEMNGIKHHMINLISLNDNYSIYDYQHDGRNVLNNLISKNKNIIIVGGSGLYIKSLLYDYDLNSKVDLNIDYSNYSNNELKSMCDDIDVNNNIHVNNRKRLERYITYYKQNNKVLKNSNNRNKRLYDFELIGLYASKEELINKINNRVECMFDSGLLNEAKQLYELNYKNFINIIGYRELDKYFKNEITLEESKELIKNNTRKYAKRQMTWFKNQMDDIKWFKVNYNDFDSTILEVKKYLRLN